VSNKCSRNNCNDIQGGVCFCVFAPIISTHKRDKMSRCTFFVTRVIFWVRISGLFVVVVVVVPISKPYSGEFFQFSVRVPTTSQPISACLRAWAGTILFHGPRRGLLCHGGHSAATLLVRSCPLSHRRLCVLVAISETVWNKGMGVQWSRMSPAYARSLSADPPSKAFSCANKTRSRVSWTIEIDLCNLYAGDFSSRLGLGLHVNLLPESLEWCVYQISTNIFVLYDLMKPILVGEAV